MRDLLLLAIILGVTAPGAKAGRQAIHCGSPFIETFQIDPNDLRPSGRNTYFVLEPGYVLSYSGREDGEAARLVITVLAETKVIDGVETRVVEERETLGGRPTEISRNYFAISSTTGDVYYFGEAVDRYENGKVAGNEGSWQAGEARNRPGLAMPGDCRVGARYFQEIAPGVAMDRGEIVSLSDSLRTPAGMFRNVLKVEETSTLEPDVREHKYYAPGIGLIRDANLLLDGYGKQ